MYSPSSCPYTGETLDYKAPLLKALHALIKAAVDVCQYFDKDITKVIALHIKLLNRIFPGFDTALLIHVLITLTTGRTLFGHSPGTTDGRRSLFRIYSGTCVCIHTGHGNRSTLKLGIPLKTRHNEVAPKSVWMCSGFQEINLAVDHNVVDGSDGKSCSSPQLQVLLHKNPYAGINGSGKHNNLEYGN